MTALDLVAAACPFAEGAAAATLEEAAGDEDLAIEALLSKAPDLRTEPEAWFNFFDADKDGKLSEEELSLAMAVTLKVESVPGYVQQLSASMFKTFDTDGSGAWDMEEFL